MIGRLYDLTDMRALRDECVTASAKKAAR